MGSMSSSRLPTTKTLAFSINSSFTPSNTLTFVKRIGKSSPRVSVTHVAKARARIIRRKSIIGDSEWMPAGMQRYGFSHRDRLLDKLMSSVLFDWIVGPPKRAPLSSIGHAASPILRALSLLCSAKPKRGVTR
jgi:hypothetical protein